MSFRRILNRHAFAFLAGSVLAFGSLASATAQLAGPDIDPFEDDLGVPSETAPATEGEQKTAEQAIQEGIDYFESGDYTNAMQIENVFLSQIPGAPGPLSVHYFEKGEYAKAMQIANFFIARNPNAAGPNLIRGKSLAAIGENELALQALSSAARSSQSPEADYETGKIYLSLRDYKNATNEFTKAVQKDAFNAEYLIMRGKAQLRFAQQLSQSQSFLGTANPQAELDQAIESLDRAIELDAENAEAYLQRSLANSFLGEMDKSVEDGQRAVSLASDDVQYAARLGFTYQRRADGEQFAFDKDLGKVIADYKNAIDAFETYLKVHGDPDSQDEELAEDPEAIAPEDVYLGRAMTHVALANTIPAEGRQTHYQQAIDDCNRTLEFEITGAERASALLQRGIAERLMGQTQVAIKSFTDAITAAGSFAEASLRRGIAYYHLGDLDSAQADFEQATLELRPDGRANFWLGVTQARRGQYADAIRYYSAALRENRGYKPAYSNRGLANMRIGRYEQAANDFSTLLKRDPDDTVARERRDIARELMDSATESK
jgi:tetratricopeptide (TPR) repeat protein